MNLRNLRDRAERLRVAAEAARLLGRTKAQAAAERELRIVRDQLRAIEARGG